ncbi:MAG: hypothetical protein JKY66_10840, partial [Spongiibacteraceae bacterium]|nr:hypothetical protein [Spongiibacteraceae bacterium]
MLLKTLHNAMESLLHVERRLEPFFRPILNKILREPSAQLIQFLINLRRKNAGLGLAEETVFDYEEESLNKI